MNAHANPAKIRSVRAKRLVVEETFLYPAMERFMACHCPGIVREWNSGNCLKHCALSRGNKSQTARILGVNRATVWNRMKKHNINLEPDWERI